MSLSLSGFKVHTYFSRPSFPALPDYFPPTRPLSLIRRRRIAESRSRRRNRRRLRRLCLRVRLENLVRAMQKQDPIQPDQPPKVHKQYTPEKNRHQRISSPHPVFFSVILVVIRGRGMQARLCAGLGADDVQPDSGCFRAGVLESADEEEGEVDGEPGPEGEEAEVEGH